MEQDDLEHFVDFLCDEFRHKSELMDSFNLDEGELYDTLIRLTEELGLTVVHVWNRNTFKVVDESDLYEV